MAVAEENVAPAVMGAGEEIGLTAVAVERAKCTLPPAVAAERVHNVCKLRR